MWQEALEVMSGVLNHSSKQLSESLSLIANKRIKISIGEINTRPYCEPVESMEASDSENFVAQQFTGDFDGILTLQMGNVECVRLLSYCLGRSVSLDSFSEKEHEAILELGNVILNAVFRSMLNITQAHLTVERPKYYSSLFWMNETVGKNIYASNFITISMEYLCLNSMFSDDRNGTMKVSLQMKNKEDIWRVLQRMV